MHVDYCKSKILLLFFCCVLGSVPFAQAKFSNGDLPQQEASSTRLAHLIRVQLPITDNVSSNIKKTLATLAEKAPRTVRPEDRSLIVLEFDTTTGKTGRGSELEACQSLARFLTSANMNHVETIGYIPATKSLLIDADPDAAETSGSLMGHSVLVAIATNRIAMAPGTSIGKAGIDESGSEKLTRVVYETVAESRLTLPLPIVMCMLEANRELSRVTLPGKAPIYADADELAKMQSTRAIDNVETVSKSGDPLQLTAEQLTDFGLIDLVPATKGELADQLNINLSALDTDVLAVDDRKAFQVPLPFKVDERASNWILDKVNEKMADGYNLMIITIDEVQCDSDAGIELAQRIAELDGRQIKTVAFVRGKARGAVGILALACDQLIMSPDARLGGFDADALQLSKEELDEQRSLVRSVAETAEVSWSLMMSMLDPGMTLTSYREQVERNGVWVKGGKLYLMSNDELTEQENPERWSAVQPYTMSDGLTAETAEQLALAVLVAEDMGQLQTFYQLDESPELVELRASEKALDQFARFLRRPLISMLLLMATFVFFSNEMSAPGLGVPGFLALLCITLYFWAMSLGGNAQWFEILMFVIGAGCLVVEIFVIPGFGVFGIGGILLIGVSLVLSAQSFFLPSTVAEFKQLPYSLLPVVGAGMGVVVGAWTLSKALPNSKYFSKFMINTGNREDTGLDFDKDPEAMVDWSFLNDASGETITRLNPAGKARIKGKVYDVISTGQLIDKGVQVVVTEAVGNRIVVQAKKIG